MIFLCRFTELSYHSSLQKGVGFRVPAVEDGVEESGQMLSVAQHQPMMLSSSLKGLKQITNIKLLSMWDESYENLKWVIRKEGPSFPNSAPAQPRFSNQGERWAGLRMRDGGTRPGLCLRVGGPRLASSEAQLRGQGKTVWGELQDCPHQLDDGQNWPRSLPRNHQLLHHSG